MDKNKIMSGIFYVLGLLPIAGTQYLPDNLSASFAENPMAPYVASGFSFAVGLFFTWRAKQQYAKAMEQANAQMAQAQAQYQASTKK